MRSNTPMTIDQIRTAAPAVFAQARNEDRTSDQYEFLSTENVLTGMMEAGYGVSRAQQKRTRKDADMYSTRHLLAFRPLKSFGKTSIGDAIPEVLLINAHDASCSYKLLMGIYRLVCENGMIVGDTFDSIRVTHRGDAVQQVVDGSAKIWEYIPKVAALVDSMDSTRLKKVDQLSFAERAMSIRHGDDRPYLPELLLQERRPEDKGDDLWHVYNRVQENLMRGGIEGHTPTGRRSVSREIGRVTKDVIYNQQLWDLTNEYLEAA